MTQMIIKVFYPDFLFLYQYNLLLFPYEQICANCFPERKTMESVRVMDMSGKCVQSIKLNDATPTLELNLGDLPKGLYVLQARGESQV